MLFVGSKSVSVKGIESLESGNNALKDCAVPFQFTDARRALASISALTLLLCAQPGNAQQAAEATQQEIEEIVIVDSRFDISTFAVGQNISVTGEQLENTRPADVEQLFQRLPGFTLSRPGGAGGVSEIFVRGAESNFTAVYVDGIRLNNSSNTRGGSFDSSMIDAFSVGQIDVATGAMSAIYGADAMAGVIRIRSAWAEPGESFVIAEAGSSNMWRAGLGTTLRIGSNAEWNLRGSATDGGTAVEGSTLQNKNFSSRLAGDWAQQGTWEVNLRSIERDRTGFPEVSGGPDFAVQRDLEAATADELSVATAAKWIVSDHWSSDLYASATRISDNTYTPSVAAGVLDAQPAFAALTEYERVQLLWVNTISLSDRLSLVAGAETVRELGSDNGFIDFGIILPNAYTMDRSISSAFLEIGQDWGSGLVSNIAFRLDDDSSDRRVSGKVGIQKQITEQGSQIWARVANGFKLPSFFALGNPLFGNPDLLVEQVDNAELGYTHVLNGDAEFIVSAYHSQYVDLVDFDFETFTNVNRGQFDVKGIELRAAIQLSSQLKFIADANFADISSSAGPLRRRPEKTGGVAFDWSPSEQWSANVSARYVGKRLITSIPTGDVIEPGAPIVGAMASFTPNAEQRYWIAIDNMFDKDYQDAPGFPSPGATVRVGLKMAL
jgi:vitamin B12 transporter